MRFPTFGPTSKKCGGLGQVVFEDLALLGIEVRASRCEGLSDGRIRSLHDGVARAGRQLDGYFASVVGVLLDRERTGRRDGANDAGDQALGEPCPPGDVSDSRPRMERDIFQHGELSGVDPVAAGVAGGVQSYRSKDSRQVMELGCAHVSIQSQVIRSLTHHQ